MNVDQAKQIVTKDDETATPDADVNSLAAAAKAATIVVKSEDGKYYEQMGVLKVTESAESIKNLTVSTGRLSQFQYI